MNKTNVLPFLGWLLITAAIAVIGSIFTLPEIDGWYGTLARPALTPPNGIFGPVWTTLYFMMAVSAFLVWRQGFDRREVRIALAIYLAQLELNALWSLVFFGAHLLFGAFIVIALLWQAILANIFAFYRISRPAAYLLVPYLIWVTFAAYLNFSIWLLTP